MDARQLRPLQARRAPGTPGPTQEELLTQLKKVDVFRAIPSSLLQSLLPTCKFSRPSNGEVIFDSNDQPAVYVVVRGRAFIVSSRGPKWEVPLLTASRGEIFGELSIMLGRQINEARAGELCELIRIDAKDIGKVLAQSQVSSFAMLALVAKRFAILQAALVQTVGTRVRERVFDVILRMAEHATVTDSRGLFIPYRVTQEHLARLVGASRYSVHQALRALAADGQIVTAGRRIILPLKTAPICELPSNEKLRSSREQSTQGQPKRGQRLGIAAAPKQRHP